MRALQELDCVSWRHFYRCASGGVRVEIRSTVDYWWYWIEAAAPGRRYWHGQAVPASFGEESQEGWCLLVVDVASGRGTSLAGPGTLPALADQLARILATIPAVMPVRTEPECLPTLTEG
jgi:hypothetical protein